MSADTTGDHEIRHAVIPVSELLKAKAAAQREYWGMVAEWIDVWIERAKSQ